MKNFIKSFKYFWYLFFVILNFNLPMRGEQKTYKSRFEEIILYNTDYCLEPVISDISPTVKNWYGYIGPLFWVKYICLGDQEPILVFENYAEQGNFQFPPYIGKIFMTSGFQNYSYDVREIKEGIKSYLEISFFSKYESQPNLVTDQCPPYNPKSSYCMNSYNPSSSTFCDVTNMICEDVLPNGGKGKTGLNVVDNNTVYEMLVNRRGMYKNQITDTEKVFFLNSEY